MVDGVVGSKANFKESPGPPGVQPARWTAKMCWLDPVPGERGGVQAGALETTKKNPAGLGLSAEKQKANPKKYSKIPFDTPVPFFFPFQPGFAGLAQSLFQRPPPLLRVNGWKKQKKLAPPSGEVPFPFKENLGQTLGLCFSS